MTTLITNLKRGDSSKATTERTNFDFNTMFEFNGNYYGGNDSSLNKFGGLDDNGTDIDFSIETVASDMGIDDDKIIRFLIVHVFSDNDFSITVDYHNGSSQVYAVTVESTGRQVVMVPISFYEYGTWISVKVENVDGNELAVYRIDAVPIVFTSGRNRLLP